MSEEQQRKDAEVERLEARKEAWGLAFTAAHQTLERLGVEGQRMRIAEDIANLVSRDDASTAVKEAIAASFAIVEEGTRCLKPSLDGQYEVVDALGDL